MLVLATGHWSLTTAGLQNDRKGALWEGRKGRPLSVMPDGGYRASSVFSLLVILLPWIPVEDGFPLKTCGNDRGGLAGMTEGALRE